MAARLAAAAATVQRTTTTTTITRTRIQTRYTRGHGRARTLVFRTNDDNEKQIYFVNSCTIISPVHNIFRNDIFIIHARRRSTLFIYFVNTFGFRNSRTRGNVKISAPPSGRCRQYDHRYHRGPLSALKQRFNFKIKFLVISARFPVSRAQSFFRYQ